MPRILPSIIILLPRCRPLQGQSSSGYFAGDKLSYADIHIYSGLSFLASGFYDGEAHTLSVTHRALPGQGWQWAAGRG